MAKIEKTMVSYSASFEDVILQRALQGIQHGCYVDVGASRPLIDNNTAALYGKGWRGICVEPLTYLNPYWEKCRPEDVLVNAAAGATSGQVTLYHYFDSTQISTCSVKTMEHWKRNEKLSDEQKIVPMVTLNQLMEQFLNGRTIHLLSIDAEGYEKQVLDGFDLNKYHPWIIIIEATIPGTRIPSHHEWEQDVLSAGYMMVYQDGINRFYLSNSRPELLKYFSAPPTVWDGFVTYEQELAETKFKNIEKINEDLNAEIAALKKTIEKEGGLPPHFWDYVPQSDDIVHRRIVDTLEKENEVLRQQIMALQQTLSLKNFLDK